MKFKLLDTEFVSAAGKTEALLTLTVNDVRHRSA
jgi:hypothetical protein